MTQAKRTSEGTSVRTSIFVTGIVQGVGFRPFVYQLASEAGLGGHVLNTSDGVQIEVEGSPQAIQSFIDNIRDHAPPLSLITDLITTQIAPAGHSEFIIMPSVATQGHHQLVSPDSCTCDDCQEELFDPGNRRYRYPFINCTNCGPRFTIIESLPYDRPQTTMKKFEMCDECRTEYEDPANRRFHAEPNACPVCGPGLWLADHSGVMLPVGDPIVEAASALRRGRIIALKGLGGFQLACIATDNEAVSRLRRRKHRPNKPFAIMAGSHEEAAIYCRISETERRLLLSAQRPIVLLSAYDDSDITTAVAPGLRRHGVMLPYTPLHFLLMDAVGVPLVMTSGNLSDEPICRTNTEAVSRLSGIADLFLLHNRGIRSTYDDSVLMVEGEREIMLRRARGYAPLPVKLPHSGPSVLSTGAELKNNFCLTSGDEAFVSQHIGDLENAETLLFMENTVALYERLFDTSPERFSCDRHPGYLSTAYCFERSRSPAKIQHHRAHIASCLADNGCTNNVVGVAFDGTGFGDDGNVWGGEFFSGSLDDGLNRAAHIQYFPLLGGEAAIHEPWRTALGLVWQFSQENLDVVFDRFQISSNRRELLVRQLEAGLNCPLTSSAGRLFDAVSALVLGRTKVSYEAQAAMELEAAAMNNNTSLSHEASPGLDLDSLSCRFSLEKKSSPWVLSPGHAISSVVAGIMQGDKPEAIAAAFHLGLAGGIVRTATRLAADNDTDTVALSGGVFQNQLLLHQVIDGLSSHGLKVLTHRQVPPNDGGISLGQAAIVLSELNNSPAGDH